MAKHWRAARHPAFLVPCFALSKIFRGKFRSGLNKLGWLNQVAPAVWKSNWVVHCQHAGQGQKVLDYLGRYVFRVAITNSRIERFEQGHLTFRYRDNRSQQIQHLRLSAGEFIGRFLQHVLPRGLVKVRSYGLASANSAHKLQQARALLEAPTPDSEPDPLTLRQNNCPKGPAHRERPIRQPSNQSGVFLPDNAEGAVCSGLEIFETNRPQSPRSLRGKPSLTLPTDDASRYNARLERENRG